LAPQHRQYFFPEPQGHGALRPTLGAVRATGTLLDLFVTRWAAEALRAAYERQYRLVKQLVGGPWEPPVGRRDRGVS